MANQGNTCGYGGVKRLALALLVAFALNATPAAAEQLSPDTPVVQAPSVDVKDIPKGDGKLKDSKDKKDKDGGGPEATSGDGGSY